MPVTSANKCGAILGGGSTQLELQAQWFRDHGTDYQDYLRQFVETSLEINDELEIIKDQNLDFYNLLISQSVGPIPINQLIITNNTNQIDLQQTINGFKGIEFDLTVANPDTLAFYGKYYFKLTFYGIIQNGVYIPDDSKIGTTLGNTNYSSNSQTKNAYRKIVEYLDFFNNLISLIQPLHEEYFNIGECFQLQSDGLIDIAGNPTAVGAMLGTTLNDIADAQGLLDADFSDQAVFTSGFGFPPIDRINFKEQCFLLAHIFNLTKIKERIDHGQANFLLPTFPDGYKELPQVNNNINRTVLVNGEPFGIVNNLTQSPYKEEFFEMTNEQLSTLQPFLRFYKVIPVQDEGNTNTCKEKELEIVFDTFDSPDDLARMFKPNSGQRDIGVGVSSFNFAYEADNPFAIKKAISAKLVIHASNFSELLTYRYNSSEPYQYIDLALHTVSPETVSLRGAGSQTHISNLTKLNFRLKVVIGWTVPPESRGLFNPQLLSAIYDSSITLNLTPTVHMFDVDDAGVVKFTIDYLAYTQEYFDNASFNIFTDFDVFNSNLIREISLRALNAKIKIDGEESAAGEEKKQLLKDAEDQNIIRDEKARSLKTLIGDFINYGRLYYINFDQFDQALYGLNSPYSLAAARYQTLEDLELAIHYAYVPVAVANLGGTLSTPISNNIQNQVDASAQQITGQTGTGTATSGGSIGNFFTSLANINSTGTSTNPAAANIIPPPAHRMVTFFYASDLIDLILDKIEKSLKYVNTLSASSFTVTNVDAAVLDCLIKAEKDKYARLYENFNKLRIMLGPMEIQEPSENSFRYEVRNIGDVPISMKNFLEFLTTKMINLEKPQYFLTQFINDFFNEFVVNMLNRDLCYGGKAVQRIFLHQNAFTEYRNNLSDEDTITKFCNNSIVGANDPFNVKCPSGTSQSCTKRLYLREDDKPNPGLPVPVLNVMGVRNDPRPSADICLEYNYIFFYAGRAIPMNQMVGCKKPTQKNGVTGCFNSKGDKVSDTGDHSRGIWHYQIGKNRGIVKTISLSRTDSTGLAEVRYEQEGYDGLKQLRVLYDVTIKSFLDISAFPGSYIYVEPRGFDVTSGLPNNIDLTQLGIGGYHMIYKSEHTISPGTAETTIHAKWVASNSPSQESVIPPESGVTPPSKCGA